jgi:transcriptional regulator with XRE-family HTH domain
MTNIGARLRRKRVELGLNQKTLADAAGVTNAAVSKWESNGGESISAIAALKIAQRLNINPVWLISGKGQPTDKIEVPDLSKQAEELARKIDRLPDQKRDAMCRLLIAMRQ